MECLQVRIPNLLRNTPHSSLFHLEMQCLAPIHQWHQSCSAEGICLQSKATYQSHAQKTQRVSPVFNAATPVSPPQYWMSCRRVAGWLTAISSCKPPWQTSRPRHSLGKVDSRVDRGACFLYYQIKHCLCRILFQKAVK